LTLRESMLPTSPILMRPHLPFHQGPTDS
jgi:hypothetical protein